MSKMHIAKKGARAGQFVPCQANIRCRNGGRHISKETFTEMKNQYGPEITLTEYTKFLQEKTGQPLKAGGTVFFRSQDEFDAFLEANGVKAHYNPSEWGGEGEQVSLYNMNTLNQYGIMFRTIEGYSSAEEAERHSLSSLFQLEAYSSSIPRPVMGDILKLASTPNAKSITRTRMKLIVDTLDDYSLDTACAYVKAVFNANNPHARI